MKKKLVALLTLCMLCLFCAVGFAACSCGGSNDNGTYYRYSNGNYDKSDYVVLDGSTMTDSDGASGKYEIKDGQIYLYVTVFGFQERISGTIKDGVMVIDGKTYCKEGCRPPLNNTNENTQHTHTYVETVISPTCVQQGYTIYKCSVCGYEETGNYIDVSDNHNYVNNICTVCGKELPPTDGSYFNFTLLTDDTYEIRVKNKNNLPSNILIAPSYYGTKVTRINDSAFENCSNLRSITIPDSVTSIGEKAFYNCSSLTSITIPNSVTSIGYDAFYGCSSLEYNEYDNGLYLGNNNNPYVALLGTRSTDIANCVIHKNTKIISGAFASCNNLKNITIPNSVISICGYAFSGCSRLTSITIPNSVTSIGEGAFHYCHSLTSITIPDSVTSIEDWAFCDCKSLTSITIPNSVTIIGEHAFYCCYNLTDIVIGRSVKSIGTAAFYRCEELLNVRFTGTKAEWQAIDKDEKYWYREWYNDGLGHSYYRRIATNVVHCSDGDITLSYT